MMKILAIALGALALLVFCTTAFPSGAKMPQPPAQAPRFVTPADNTVEIAGVRIPNRSMSTECRLACIDERTDIRESDPIVGEYKRALSSLSVYYGDSTETIATEALSGKVTLKEFGIASDVLPILTGLRDVGALRIKGDSFRRDLAIYITLRDQGGSHQTTIAKMTQFVMAR